MFARILLRANAEPEVIYATLKYSTGGDGETFDFDTEGERNQEGRHHPYPGI
jgi:hypothetical protein